jgi:hypothetical protein
MSQDNSQSRESKLSVRNRTESVSQILVESDPHTDRESHSIWLVEVNKAGRQRQCKLRFPLNNGLWG